MGVADIERVHHINDRWCCKRCLCCADFVEVHKHITAAIERAFRAETARNYRAAAQRGEYPIR